MHHPLHPAMSHFTAAATTVSTPLGSVALKGNAVPTTVQLTPLARRVNSSVLGGRWQAGAPQPHWSSAPWPWPCPGAGAVRWLQPCRPHAPAGSTPRPARRAGAPDGRVMCQLNWRIFYSDMYKMQPIAEFSQGERSPETPFTFEVITAFSQVAI